MVKLIDVYPDTVRTSRPGMGGYQFMVASEILRGRYRRAGAARRRWCRTQVTAFTVDLHQQGYTFRRGHRIMVQVQSTWFPVYDRNPQTWVPNIFEATPADFRRGDPADLPERTYPSHVEVQVIDR